MARASLMEARVERRGLEQEGSGEEGPGFSWAHEPLLTALEQEHCTLPPPGHHDEGS